MPNCLSSAIRDIGHINFRVRLVRYCVQLHYGIVLGRLSLLWLAITRLRRKLGQSSSPQKSPMVQFNSIRELKHRRQWEEQLVKQQLCAYITLFRTFLCRYCTTTTWNCLISRFVEDVNTRKQLSFLFSWTSIQSIRNNSRKNWQHLKNWTRWGKQDKVWSRANSLFKWRSRCRRPRHCCLSPLMASTAATAGKHHHSLLFHLVQFAKC